MFLSRRGLVWYLLNSWKARAARGLDKYNSKYVTKFPCLDKYYKMIERFSHRIRQGHSGSQRSSPRPSCLHYDSARVVITDKTREHIVCDTLPLYNNHNFVQLLAGDRISCFWQWSVETTGWQSQVQVTQTWVQVLERQLTPGCFTIAQINFVPHVLISHGLSSFSSSMKNLNPFVVKVPANSKTTETNEICTTFFFTIKSNIKNKNFHGGHNKYWVKLFIRSLFR